MTKFVEKRNCPSCGASHNNSSPKVSAKVPAERLSERELKEYFVGFRKEQCFFTYSRCDGCGLLYCTEYFTEYALNVLYSSMPENTSVSGERDSAKTQAGYSRYLRKIKQGRFLEIGADLGLLSKFLLSQKKFVFVDAVEPNEKVKNLLTQNLQNNGKIYSSLDDIHVNSFYDSIGAIHVFDHLLYPKKTLEKISEIAKNDATLLVVVHNERSILRKILRKTWPPFCLQHPQIYSPKTFKTLTEKTGFIFLEKHRTTNFISLKQGIDLLRSIGLVHKKFPNFLPSFPVPIKLGNMAITLRKVTDHKR